ncbi:chemotaxis protein [Enterovibrio norvegicus FF-33]|uniref:Chemotaxis protein n=3 Tax=Enterovibrio norvegicus TaxID=188144 RepID=A0A1E5C2L4_9GAMM|nr:methyl-accepting chemotaxis protein [Enterovibrio norvegicus]OEE59711.1 chemotaxis protein [Enterovibrio norvegicus FF-454]OEE70197.1 chemotaxis protein [Enterovibrio norvegicus FF-33]
MKLSVVQRTIAGFALMFVLMAILSSISLFNAKTLQGKVEQITNQSTPMVVASGDLITQLMRTSLLIRTFQNDPTNANRVDQQFDRQKQSFFQTLSQAQQNAQHDDERRQVNAIHQASTRYFEQARTLINLQKQSDTLIAQRQTLDLQFLRLEDTYQWAANLLLQKAAVKRSLHNRAELITSGIARDMKMLRRADQDTDLNQLRSALAKDIEIAFKRLERISVEDDVKARYSRNLKKVEQLTLAESGVLDVMSRQQQVNAQLQRESTQTDKQMNDIQSRLQAYADYAQQLAQTSRDDAETAVSEALLYIIVMTSVAAAISLWVGVSTTRSIQKPLALITNVLHKMTDGDMRTRANYHANDEFGELSRSIDMLADTMSRTLAKFGDGAKHLLSEASRAALVSDSAMTRVEDQKSRTDQVAAAISEMEVSAKEISRSTELTVAEVENTNQTANSGRAQVSLSRQLTEQLSSNIGEAVSNTQQLNQYSNNIGSILHVIQDIAEQTNLLALNAAIEAARAGSHGRGFAVVADEVRALATRTQQSTEEIQQMINNLQGNASRMAETMSASQKQMDDCLIQTRLTDETLQDIVARMEAIQDMAVHVAQATEEQIKVSHEVAEHINGIAHVAYEAEKDARESASSSESLANLAQDQQNLISNFRV